MVCFDMVRLRIGSRWVKDIKFINTKTHILCICWDNLWCRKNIVWRLPLSWPQIGSQFVRKERPEKKNVPMMLRTRLAKTKSQHANEQNCQMPNSTKIVLRIVHIMFAPHRSSKIRNYITLCTMKVLREGHVYLQRLVSFRLAARKILDSHLW